VRRHEDGIVGAKTMAAVSAAAIKDDDPEIDADA
jgi:hypothetical protein